MKFKVEGLDEVQAALRQLPNATAKNVVRRVLKNRAQPIADAAKALAPMRFGELRDSITVSTKLTRSQRRQRKKVDRNDIEIYVGPDSRPQAHMLEFGTGPRRHKSGKEVGQITPTPFMRPAWDGEKMKAFEGMKDDLWAEIRKAVARQAKKAAKAAAASEGE